MIIFGLILLTVIMSERGLHWYKMCMGAETQRNTYLAHLKMAMWNLRQQNEKLAILRETLSLIGRHEFPVEASRSALKEEWEMRRVVALKAGSTI